MTNQEALEILTKSANLKRELELVKNEYRQVRSRAKYLKERKEDLQSKIYLADTASMHKKIVVCVRDWPTMDESTLTNVFCPSTDRRADITKWPKHDFWGIHLRGEGQPRINYHTKEYSEEQALEVAKEWVAFGKGAPDIELCL